ncbi:MAG: hypothetical protein ABIQ06_15045 [Caldimonas sp.]
MNKLIKLAGLTLCLGAGASQATDVINQDSKGYKITVQGEGKLSISTHTVRAGGSMYGLCNYSFCTFEIPGHKVAANKDGRLTIRGGKFVK